MADQQSLEWLELDDDIAVAQMPIPVAPAGAAPTPDDDPDHPRFRLFDSPFSAILIVRVKSDTDTGRDAHNHLLGLLRNDPRVPDDIKRLIPDDPRFALLRANAELPANPVRRTAILAISGNPGTITGIEIKDRA